MIPVMDNGGLIADGAYVVSIQLSSARLDFGINVNITIFALSPC
jgi:hypothetical protein